MDKKVYQYFGEQIEFVRKDSEQLSISILYLDKEFNCFMPYDRLTVNLPGNLQPKKDEAYIDLPHLDWDGKNSLNWLEEQGLVKQVGHWGSSGYNYGAYPLVRFTKKFFEEALGENYKEAHIDR